MHFNITPTLGPFTDLINNNQKTKLMLMLKRNCNGTGVNEAELIFHVIEHIFWIIFFFIKWQSSPIICANLFICIFFLKNCFHKAYWTIVLVSHWEELYMTTYLPQCVPINCFYLWHEHILNLTSNEKVRNVSGTSYRKGRERFQW